MTTPRQAAFAARQAGGPDMSDGLIPTAGLPDDSEDSEGTEQAPEVAEDGGDDVPPELPDTELGEPEDEDEDF